MPNIETGSLIRAKIPGTVECGVAIVVASYPKIVQIICLCGKGRWIDKDSVISAESTRENSLKSATG